MRKAIAALLATPLTSGASLATPLTAAALLATPLTTTLAVGAARARAAPTEVDVRIEGATQTLFEGPILTEGHDVEASSDAQERPCDGINPNDPHNTVPGATPTAAAVDAMSLIGETFDGRWDAGTDDYFITRWGPDREEKGMSWGILVNDVFTSVGGCQYELADADEALWAYDAFAHRPLLALYPAGDTGARPLTATAQLGRPFAVEVLDYPNDKEGTPPAAPERAGSAPFAGALVAPVQTAANGFEQIEIASPASVTTGAEGRASVTFTEPGWHRIKATALAGDGEEDAIRSNRLDVCVPAEGKSGCGEPPREDDVHVPAYLEEGKGPVEEHAGEPTEEPKQGSGGEGSGGSGAGGSAPGGEGSEHESEVPPGGQGATGAAGAGGGVLSFTASNEPGPVRIQAPVLDGAGAARGLVGVSWRVLEAGAGVRSWSISAEALGRTGAGYAVVASGASATAALLSLAPGVAYELRITIVDALGRSSTTPIGRVLVPLDDRWGGLRYHGRWTRAALRGAWRGTVTRGEPGAWVTARLQAGRPAFLVRASARAARVEVRAGSHDGVFTIAGAAGAARWLTAADRAAAGTVSLRVLKGTVELDGVAVEP